MSDGELDSSFDREVVAPPEPVAGGGSRKRGREQFDITAKNEGLLSDAHLKEVAAHMANKNKKLGQGNVLQAFAALMNDSAKFDSFVAVDRDLAMPVGGMLDGDALTQRELFLVVEYAFSLLLDVDAARRQAVDADLSGFPVPAQLIFAQDWKDLPRPAHANLYAMHLSVLLAYVMQMPLTPKPDSLSDRLKR